MDQINQLMSAVDDREKALAFVARLTALTHEYGIGICGSPVLFVMEEQDRELAYCIDAESALTFG